LSSGSLSLFVIPQPFFVCHPAAFLVCHPQPFLFVVRNLSCLSSRNLSCLSSGSLSLFVIPHLSLFVIPQPFLFVIPQPFLFVIPQRSGGICFFLCLCPCLQDRWFSCLSSRRGLLLLQCSAFASLPSFRAKARNLRILSLLASTSRPP
jgi:hypothetical protein